MSDEKRIPELLQIESQLRDIRDTTIRAEASAVRAETIAVRAETTAVRAETKADSHVANCIEHNRRVEEALRDGYATRARQHLENQASIELVKGQVAGLSNRMTATLISALGAIVAGLATALYEAFAHKIGM